MNLYEVIWPNHDFHKGINTVQCFLHDDTVASAHLDYEKGLFHCKVCDEGMNAVQLASEYFGIPTDMASLVLNKINKGLSPFDWNPLKVDLKNNPDARLLLTEQGISDEVLDSVNPGFTGYGISLPVTVGGIIVDIRTYNPTGPTKMKSMAGAMTGFIFPEQAFDSKTIFLVEGEKDALNMRTLGLNGATVIGGAQAVPNKTPAFFRNHNVVIIYDNDDAGLKGAKKTAKYLLEQDLNIKVKIVDIAPLVDGKNKGDVTDAILEYGKTSEDFIEAVKKAPESVLEDFEKEIVRVSEYKSIKLEEADKHFGELLKSKVQVVAAHDSSFSVPSEVIFTDKNESALWKLDAKNNMKDVLYQLEYNGDKSVTPSDRDLGEMDKDTLVRQVSKERRRVFKALVGSAAEDIADTDKLATEHLAYIMDTPVDSGKEYIIYYRITPNPKTNRSTLVVHKIEDLAKSEEEFVITDEVKASLDKFGTKTFDELIEQAKGIVNANFNTKLITVIDLTFHSVLSFNFWRNKLIKGTINSIVVTDTGFGKSITSQALLAYYKQGGRASLTGSAATPQGLIGGSKPIGNSGTFQTTAGLIPRMHKKLVFLEELAKNKSDIMKELTDIRTSGKAEIARVSGKMTLPANTRLGFFSNPKANKDGGNKTVDAYPNGIEIIQDLLGAREDIGRFDLIATLGQRESIEIDLSWVPEETFDQIDYQRRLNWIWTRKPEQVVFDEEVTNYIGGEKTKELNAKFESDVQIFGRKTMFKLARLSATIAGYMGSHSDDYESIIIKKEHVDEAVKLFNNLYDNPTFKLKEHAAEERAYTQVDKPSTDVLRRINSVHNQIITQLGQHSEIRSSDLKMVADLDNQRFNEIISDLTKFKLIRNIKSTIEPTEKFRKILDVVGKEPVEAFPSTVEEEAFNAN